MYLDPNDPNNCISNYEPIVITNIINDINNNQVTVEWTGGLPISTIEINLLTGIAYNIDSNLENNGSYTFDIPCSIILDANNDGIPDENDDDVTQNFIKIIEILEGIGCNDCNDVIIKCPTSFN